MEATTCFRVGLGLGRVLSEPHARGCGGPGLRLHQAKAVVDSRKRLGHRSQSRRMARPVASVQDTRTPHSGYHFDGSGRRFFEGWYFRISLPESKQSLAWMYAIGDPNPKGPLSLLPVPPQGPRFSTVDAQVMGPDDEYLWQQDGNVDGFWGATHELALGHTFKLKPGGTRPGGMVGAQDFDRSVAEGFQVSTTLHEGTLYDNGLSRGLQTVPRARWSYTTRPIYGWGDVGGEQKSTAGWLAALPAFEPHWQVCMAGGLSTGWVEWGDKRFDFVDAPSYAEKNWGGSFPKKWFWVQCNLFDNVVGQVAVTAGGGRRELPLFGGQNEDVAMVGVHFGGKFFEFVPWAGTVSWEITPWGRWSMRAQTEEYEVELEASTRMDGVVLRAPTAHAGFAPFCKDTFFGDLRLCLWERTRSGARGKVILDATSECAGLEVGGGPWWDAWVYTSKMADPLRSLVGLPIDPTVLPQPLQPPGL